MGRHSHYAPRPLVEGISGGIPEHHFAFHNDARGYTPDAGETDGDGKYGNLAASAVTDSSWKAARFYRNDPGNSTSAELERQMPTYRPRLHPRACPRCLLTSCLSLITQTVSHCA